MGISRVLVILAVAGSSVLAQMGTMESLRDPRLGNDQGNGQQPPQPVIQPWLAVSGGYSTEVDTPPGTAPQISRSLGLSGGLSISKPFRRTTVLLSYGGSGFRELGQSAFANGWLTSNVVSLSVGTQLSRRLTFDIGEFAGIANGGFGLTAWGLPANSNGVMESIGVASGYLYGGPGVPSGASTVNPLQNNLVSNESSSLLTYFSTTSASLGVLLTRRTVLSFGGSGSFVRRVGGAYSDSNSYSGSAGLNTLWTRNFSTSAGYSFTRIDFVNSIGHSDINTVSVGAQYRLSAHDEVSGSFGMSFVSTQFLATLVLPPEIAQLLGVPEVYFIQNSSHRFSTGAGSYSHSFHRGGFGISCSSSVGPGNDLLLLARMESCGASLSRSIGPRMSVSGLTGASRLNGLAQAGSRYDIVTAGVSFSYRFLGGLAFTAGSSYSKNYIKPSTAGTSYVSANAGLYWSPERGLKFF